MSQQRVLAILPSLGVGGAEHYALRLLQQGRSAAAEWHVTSGNFTPRTLESAFLDAGAFVHHASPGLGNPARLLSFFLFLRRHRFDAVMSFNGVFAGVALSLARIAGVPIRIAWHRRSTPAYRPSLLRGLYAGTSLRLLDWASTHILSNSRAALDRFHGSAWQTSPKFQVIPNGVDATRFKPRPELGSRIRTQLGLPADAFVLGHVGRVDPAKDHNTLFAATRMLRNRFDNLRLVLVGPGTDQPDLLQRLAINGIEDVTRTTGARDDVHELYSAFDVFVFPSVTEGQPNALIEAMLSGIPIVATDIPGVREAVPPSHRPRLVPPKNSIALADEVQRVASSSRSTSDGLREWSVERFDMERNLDWALRPLGADGKVSANA